MIRMFALEVSGIFCILHMLGCAAVPLINLPTFFNHHRTPRTTDIVYIYIWHILIISSSTFLQLKNFSNPLRAMFQSIWTNISIRRLDVSLKSFTIMPPLLSFFFFFFFFFFGINIFLLALTFLSLCTKKITRDPYIFWHCDKGSMMLLLVLDVWDYVVFAGGPGEVLSKFSYVSLCIHFLRGQTDHSATHDWFLNCIILSGPVCTIPTGGSKHTWGPRKKSGSYILYEYYLMKIHMY